MVHSNVWTVLCWTTKLMNFTPFSTTCNYESWWDFLKALLYLIESHTVTLIIWQRFHITEEQSGKCVRIWLLVSHTSFLHTICQKSIICCYMSLMSSQQSPINLCKVITNCCFIIFCSFISCFFLFLNTHRSNLLLTFFSIDSGFSIFLDVFHLLF